jgi:hypothetical protein
MIKVPLGKGAFFLFAISEQDTRQKKKAHPLGQAQKKPTT